MDKPYKLNNKWVLDTYFRGSISFEKITFDWASIHFLALGRYYQNGDINNSEINKNAIIIDLDLSNIQFQMVEDSLELKSNGTSKQITTKIFIGNKNGIEYRIPALEVVRAVITTNRFLLNRVVELDVLDKYFVYEFDNGNNLYINFFDEYERKLLNTEYVKHLAWIISNENVLKMFNQIGKYLWLHEDLKFQFLFNKFNAKVRIGKDQNILRILEIIEFREKEINAESITISSKYIKHTRKIDQPKRRKYRALRDIEEKTLDPKIDGANSIESDFIVTTNAKHFYSHDNIVKRHKIGEHYIRDEEDESTETYDIENNNLRTTADTGGMDKAKGLEYRDIDDIIVQGELQEFIEIMKLLRKKPGVEDVQVIINDLPEGKKGKKFSKCNNGESNRRYVVGKITMDSGTKYSLIEVEREEKSLSMLLLQTIKPLDWANIYLKVTVGLVNKNGTWDSQGLKQLEGKGVISKRIRHKSGKGNVVDKCDYLYEKLINNN